MVSYIYYLFIIVDMLIIIGDIKVPNNRAQLIWHELEKCTGVVKDFFCGEKKKKKNHRRKLLCTTGLNQQQQLEPDIFNIKTIYVKKLTESYLPNWSLDYWKYNIYSDWVQYLKDYKLSDNRHKRYPTCSRTQTLPLRVIFF